MVSCIWYHLSIIGLTCLSNDQKAWYSKGYQDAYVYSNPLIIMYLATHTTGHQQNLHNARNDYNPHLHHSGPSRSSDLSMWPTTIGFNVTWILRTTQLGLCPHNTHLTSHPHWQAMAQIAKTQGLMSIRYRSNTKVLDRYLIDVNLSLCYLGGCLFQEN